MITLHPDRVLGPLRPVHGVNRGPIDRNWYLDLRPWFKRWRIPCVRMHDSIYNAFDTVDLHHLFPDPEADPLSPASYRFKLTDDLLQAVRDTGAKIYFRLGESIEHQPTMMWNCPDRWRPEQLAQVCVQIVRHYREGWADGFHWDIEHWEFWNEPDGPKNWTGSPETFFRFYRAVAHALKAHDASLKVGAAGFGSYFQSSGPAGKEWRDWVARCAREKVPLDFLSWHKYLTTWQDARNATREVRRFLDSLGLHETESHLGEWSYRPFLQLDERAISIFQTRNMKRYDWMRLIGNQQRSSRGAALIFGTLATLQDAPVEQAQYYCGDTSVLFGLFDEFGLPNKRGLAFEAFSHFWNHPSPERIEVTGAGEDLAVLAIREGEGRLRIGIASMEPRLEISLKIDARPGQIWKFRRLTLLDEIHDGEEAITPESNGTGVTIPLGGAGVAILELVCETIPVDPVQPAPSKRPSVMLSANAAPEGDW